MGVRAGCIAYSLFVIYSTESQQLQNEEMKEEQKKLTADSLGAHDLLQPNFHALAKSISVDSSDAIMAVSDNEDETEEKLEITDEQKKQIEEEKRKQNVKIAKVAQRPFLFEDEKFMQMFAVIIGHGIEDRGKESREKAMKCLKKIESSHKHILEMYMDSMHLKKYEKWKKFNAPKGKKKNSKKKRRSPIKRAKTTAPKKMIKSVEESENAESKSQAHLDIHVEDATLSKSMSMR